jgi:hypothetical protein
MSERCIVRIKFTPAGSDAEVRRAVGGFLRYVQHRDLHPDSIPPRPTPEIAGLLKYVAYRDKASGRAELFGPQGPIGTLERKGFAEFVANSVERSEPQLFTTRDGRLVERRRAVSRFVISPERGQGLDLERLTRAAVARLESEMGVSDLRWIAAIHRNTRHHHVHLVLAGMHEDGRGGYRQVDISKPRLAAMKQAISLEIERQRSDRTPSRQVPAQVASVVAGGDASIPALKSPAVRPSLIRTPPAVPMARYRSGAGGGSEPESPTRSRTIFRLRAVARGYQRRMQREAEEEARRLGCERAA